MPTVCNCNCGRNAATIFNRNCEAWDDVCVFIFVLVEVDIKKEHYAMMSAKMQCFGFVVEKSANQRDVPDMGIATAVFDLIN